MDALDLVGGRRVVYGTAPVGAARDGVGSLLLDLGRGRLDSTRTVVLATTKLVGCELDLLLGDGYTLSGTRYLVLEGGGIFKEKGQAEEKQLKPPHGDDRGGWASGKERSSNIK